MPDKLLSLLLEQRIFMGIEKKWVVKEPGNPASVRQLAQELGIDQVLAKK